MQNAIRGGESHPFRCTILRLLVLDLFGNRHFCVGRNPEDQVEPFMSGFPLSRE